VKKGAATMKNGGFYMVFIGWNHQTSGIYCDFMVLKGIIRYYNPYMRFNMIKMIKHLIG
jgi:hypothetical protein